MTKEERNDAIEFFKKVAEKEVNGARYSRLAIEALSSSDFTNKLISVDERLPEDGTWNIWQSKTGEFSVERYKADAIDHFFPPGRFFQFEDAIAWMPLPETYKPDENVAHWIVHPKGIYAQLVCDNCLSSPPYFCKTNYCPNCGKKMIEPQESEDKE